jgi:hypothetical protein
VRSKSTEFIRKKVTWTAVAAMAAIGLGIITVVEFKGTTTDAHTLSIIAPASTTSGPVLPPENGFNLNSAFHSRNVDCSLATGTCTLEIVNNSTYAFVLEGCQMTSIISSVETTSKSTTTVYTIVNGTTQGGATSIPSGSQQALTCAIGSALLANTRAGSPADGTFLVKFADPLYNVPAGMELRFDFQGTWS